MKDWIAKTLKEIESLEWNIEITNKDVGTINDGCVYLELYSTCKCCIMANDWLVFLFNLNGPIKKGVLYKLGTPIDDMFHLDEATKTIIDFDKPKQ